MSEPQKKLKYKIMDDAILKNLKMSKPNYKEDRKLNLDYHKFGKFIKWENNQPIFKGGFGQDQINYNLPKMNILLKKEREFNFKIIVHNFREHLNSFQIKKGNLTKNNFYTFKASKNKKQKLTKSKSVPIIKTKFNKTISNGMSNFINKDKGEENKLNWEKIFCYYDLDPKGKYDIIKDLREKFPFIKKGIGKNERKFLRVFKPKDVCYLLNMPSQMGVARLKKKIIKNNSWSQRTLSDIMSRKENACLKNNNIRIIKNYVM